MEADRPVHGPGTAAQLSIGLIAARRIVLNARKALLDVVAGGRSDLPLWPTAAERKWNRRAVLVLGTAFVIALWDFLLVAESGYNSTVRLVTGAAGALAVVSVLACYRRPILGFRILLLTVAAYVLILPNVGQMDFAIGPTWFDAAPMVLVAAMLVVLFAVAEQHRFAELCWVGVLATAALNLTSWYDSNGGEYGWDRALPTLVLFSAVLLIGYVVQLARVANEQRVRTASEQANTALLQERSYIARELHDVVAHHMSMLALRADSAQYRFPDLTEEVRTEFAALCATAREGLTEMRRLLGVLRAEDEAAETAPQPSLREIKDLVDGLRAAGTQVSLSMYVVADELPRALGLSAYRIVQEALSNAVRHAAGAAIRVDVWTTDAALHIEVNNTAATGQDPPKADQEQPQARHGLLGMRERVNMLGGQLSTGPAEDGGFTVLAVLPLRDGLDDET